MHRVDSQVILVINPMFKRSFNPTSENLEHLRALYLQVDPPPGELTPCWRYTWTFSLLVSLLLKVANLVITVENNKTWPHFSHKVRDLADMEWFPLNPALFSVVRRSFEHGGGVKISCSYPNTSIHREPPYCAIWAAANPGDLSRSLRQTNSSFPFPHSGYCPDIPCRFFGIDTGMLSYQFST